MKFKKKKFKHLSVFERAKIEVLLKLKTGVREIARQLKRDPGVVSREIKKYKTNRYRPEVAHTKALENRSKRGKRNLLKNEFVKDYVETAMMELGWTPEQVHLRLPIDTEGIFKISHEAIYQYIYSDDAPKDLRKYLPRRHRQRHRKGYRKVQKLERLNVLNSIENRPKIATERVEVGHLECDTIVSKQSKERIKSINDLTSGFVMFSKIANGTKEVSSAKIVERLKVFPPEYLKTLTSDRGQENYDYQTIKNELNMTQYFAHPYCSHERGANENLNGLFRRYFPKKTNFSKVSDEQVRQVECLINNTPRKRFGGKTPREMLFLMTGVAITY